MIFFFVFMMVFGGMLVMALPGLVPLSMQASIPDMFRYVFFIVGLVISFVGLFMLFTRAKKTGAEHLLDFGRPGTAIWFYIYRDGTLKITPAIILRI